MKSLMLLPLLALSTAASAGEAMVGVGGGMMWMDNLETLDSTWYVAPRVTYFIEDAFGVEAEFGFLAGRTRIGDYPYTALTPRVSAIGRLWTNTDKDPLFHPLLVAGIGTFNKFTNDDGALGDEYVRNDSDFLIHAGPGALVPFADDRLHLRTDLRWVVNLGSESFRLRGDRFVNWEWTVGFGVNFGGKKDTDKDGILDEVDQCIEQMEDADGFEDEDGCPDDDNDGDGISDASDQCPDESEGDKDGFQDDDGCPDPDNDEDGIADADDVCPDVAGMESAQGCPDEDGDSVVDAKDECVDEAGDKRSFGCPDEDQDHVPDYRDMCPEDPVDTEADALRSNGCPSKVVITKDHIKILDKVFFNSGRSTIQRKSNALLDNIADTLENNATIKKVEVEGHTDNTGDPEANMVLSQERAQAVVDYLVGKGIEADRLVAKGFGQTKPRVDGEEGNTDEGRAANRRVEFHITEQEASTVTFTRERLEVEEAAVEMTALKAKKAFVPKAVMTGDTTCNATLSIDAEGTVTSVAVKGCVAIPRSVARRTFQKWSFEPVLVDGEASAVTANMDMVFTKGVPSVVLDEKSVKPVE